MLASVLCCLTASLPQNPIQLPPVREKPPPPPVVRQPAAGPAFADLAYRLRRSQVRNRTAEEKLLNEVAAAFPDAAARATAMARGADADLLYGLLLMIDRFGGAAEAKALELLLLSRPLGGATEQAIQVMVRLAGDDAKPSLLSCITGRYAGLRRAAAGELAPLLDASDAPVILGYLTDARLDVRERAMSLLGHVPTADVRARLREALSLPESHLAATACEALLDHGTDAGPELQPLLLRPASDRGFGYACFALTKLELDGHGSWLTLPMVPHLRRELDGHDPFMRVCSAIALCQLAFRSDAAGADPDHDRPIVDGLLLVVAPGSFVPSYGLLQPVAAELLRRFSGRDYTVAADWQAWWQTVRGSFVGLRRSVQLNAENGHLGVVALRTPEQRVWLLGEAVSPPAAAAGGEIYRLAGAELAEVVAKLQTAGFMSPALERSASRALDALPRVRSLELRVGGARVAYDGPARDDPWMDRFVEVVTAVARRERWQLYHAPPHGSFAEFWQAERVWLAGHGERTARDRRLKDLILAALPHCQGDARVRALAHLDEIPDLDDLLTAADGQAIVAAVRAGERLDGTAERLLAVALRVPEDGAWRPALATVDRFLDAGGRDAMPRLLTVLGPERVLASITEGPVSVRLAAIYEAANMRELRAVPALLAAARESEAELQQTAVYALGVLAPPEARKPLLDALPGMEPASRRVALVALGRIGGDGVLPVLLQATTQDSLDDKRAAIQALGKLDDPLAADYLASLLVAAGPGPLGDQIVAALRDQGSIRGRAALRRQLDSVSDGRVRAEVVQVLAEFQDPIVVPDLIDLLDDQRLGLTASFQLASITGVDLTAVDDRTGFMRLWWARNRDLPQAGWYLDGLRAAGMQTSLRPEQLQPHAGPGAVPELTRLLSAVEAPHLRVLTLALLRDTTQRDFGSVSPQSAPEEVAALADRYRFWAEAAARAERR